MPVLTNGRHERFCQEIISGKSAIDAYENAGFKRNKGNASKLRQRTAIQIRVQELQQESAGLIVGALAAEVEVTVDSLLAELEEARQLAIECKQPNSMTMATIGKARITGKIIDRREVGDVGAFDGMTDDELVKAAAKKAKELGVPHLKLVDDDDESSAA